MKKTTGNRYGNYIYSTYLFILAEEIKQSIICQHVGYINTYLMIYYDIWNITATQVNSHYLIKSGENRVTSRLCPGNYIYSTYLFILGEAIEQSIIYQHVGYVNTYLMIYNDIWNITATQVNSHYLIKSRKNRVVHFFYFLWYIYISFIMKKMYHPKL